MSRILVLCALAALAVGVRADGPVPLFRVVKDGKWGYVDATGRLVVPPRFDRAEPFSEGLAAVKLGRTLGYADASGEVVLVPRFEPGGTLLHRPFASGLAAVRSAGRYGFMDRKGDLAIPARYIAVGDFSEGFALACVEQGCGYVDASGRGVVPPSFMASRPVKGGLACGTTAMAMSRERVQLVFVSGRKIEGTFEGCGALSEGLVAVRLADRWGYLDESGRPAIPLRFAWAGDFSGGLAPAQEVSGGCGYVDRGGRFVIPPRFGECAPFAGDRARVDLEPDPHGADRVAFIDRTGKVVFAGADLDPPFDAAEDFSNGLAAVGSGGPPHLAGAGGPWLGYVDAGGRYVWMPTH